MPTQPDRFQNRETDRKYIKFKMKQIKKEHNRGNKAAVERHRIELFQYLSLGTGGETPIEPFLEPLE